jgi:hypothetical protein
MRQGRNIDGSDLGEEAARETTMGLRVIFISGVRRCGKSAVAATLIQRLSDSPPHYIRLVEAGTDKSGLSGADLPASPVGAASARQLEYDAHRVFEILPDALTAIHKKDRNASVVIEADADPNLRHAYPYDYRVFVMPSPDEVSTVFRNPEQAAGELKRALDDTAAFAEEIYGLFAETDENDAEPSEPRADLSAAQAHGFLQSPLGDELATRIQLQRPYHGLVESEIIVVNDANHPVGPQTEQCLRRIKQLLHRVRGGSSRRTEIFLCDPANPTGRVGRAMMVALLGMCKRTR